jgi:hypothetical protein
MDIPSIQNKFTEFLRLLDRDGDALAVIARIEANARSGPSIEIESARKDMPLSSDKVALQVQKNMEKKLQNR